MLQEAACAVALLVFWLAGLLAGADPADAGAWLGLAGSLPPDPLSWLAETSGPAFLAVTAGSSQPWNPVHSTDEAAYAVDPQGVIVAWNAAAERVFGITAEAAVGRSCWELFGGHDVFDNRYCGQDCPVRDMARRHEIIHSARLWFRTACPGLQPFDVSMMQIPDDAGATLLVHLCRPVTPDAGHETASGPGPSPNRQRGSLTPRELEVLRLLAAGRATDEIASDLCLSAVTVRNHVQKILYKLRVHNRIAAVAKARHLKVI